MSESEKVLWECPICGYIYDPALNDDVDFEDLPDDWLCPGCGFEKEIFRPLRKPD